MTQVLLHYKNGSSFDEFPAEYKKNYYTLKSKESHGFEIPLFLG